MGRRRHRDHQPLTHTEESILVDDITGQFSDGWGEHFEQWEVKTSDGAELFVSFWQSGPGYQLTQEPEQKGGHDLEPSYGIG